LTAEEERLIEQSLRRRPEAIVVTGGRHTARCSRLLKATAIPVVEMWDLPRRPIGHVVGFSNAACLGDLVDHLVGRGVDLLSAASGKPEKPVRITVRPVLRIGESTR
jgi:LacI family gluconate utilization system Gnt-I transcriptional repressor